MNARISGVGSIYEFKPEKYHGVMIVNAKEKESGFTSKEEIIKLPAFVLSCLILIFYILYVIVIDLYSYTTNLYFKSIFAALILSSLTLLVLAYNLLFTSITGLTFINAMYLLTPFLGLVVNYSLVPYFRSLKFYPMR